MSARSACPIAAPEEQPVTFVELFFDLVFVFSLTKVVGLLHHDFGWAAAGRAALVFWLVWWAWTQFTWALNAADTKHTLVRLGTLLATAVTFFMAIAVPEAMGERSLWFAVSYVIVRAIGLGMYLWVVWWHSAHRRAVISFAAMSAFGLCAVLAGGAVGGTAQYGLWGLAIALDVLAGLVSTKKEGFRVQPAHFGERHALFVIIALGETLVVAAGGVTGAAWTIDVLEIAALAVATTCALWWTYFPLSKPRLEGALHAQSAASQSNIAGDAFSLLHFPVLCGIVAFALAVEQSLAHAGQTMPREGTAALAASVLLFVGGTGLALWRATGRVPFARLALAAATGLTIAFARGISVHTSLVIALAGATAVAVFEQVTARSSAATT